MKKQIISASNFPQLPILVCSGCLNPLFQNKNPYSATIVFHRISQPLDQNKQSSKHCQLTPYIVETIPFSPFFKGNTLLCFLNSPKKKVQIFLMKREGLEKRGEVLKKAGVLPIFNILFICYLSVCVVCSFTLFLQICQFCK